MCGSCPVRAFCTRICEVVENMLPSMERGRLDHEDLARIYFGMQMTQAVLDNLHLLTKRQQQVAHLYFRERKLQREIASTLQITQQAVHDALLRAKRTIGRKLGYNVTAT